MRTPTATDPWVKCHKPNPQAKLRLFCLPYAGGGSSLYLPWADFLPASIEVCAVLMPGREERLSEPPFTRIGPVVHLLADVMERYTSLSSAFFGHSMGALIGFELARELRRREVRAPVMLIASGCRAPQLPDPDPPIHGLDAPAFVDELRRLDGTPEEVLQNAELMELLRPLLRADFALCEMYVYIDGAPLDCAVSVYGGMDDPRTSRAELEAWRLQTRRSFRLQMFPGNHFYLQQAPLPVVQQVARDLQPFL